MGQFYCPLCDEMTDDPELHGLKRREPEGIPVTITPQGFVETIKPGQQTCGCTAVHYPCPINNYR